MPITYIKNGNIFDSKMQTLVNPVNCVGIMGKGLTKAFKLKFPDIFKIYEDECSYGKMIGGSVLLRMSGEKQVACFATKVNWRNPSRYDYIVRGLNSLKSSAQLGLIKSLAIPALGCGLGELDWPEVQDYIEQILGNLSIPIEVYEPREN